MTGGWTEEIKVEGKAMVDRFRELIHEGNVRRITLKDDKGRTVVEFPVTIGIVAVLAAPLVSAVGALAAVAGKWTLVVERSEESPSPEEPDRSTQEGGAGTS
jgi:Flp pilus assembly pilin Flp